jgi:hypothetical protein
VAKQQAIWIIVTGAVPTAFRAREREDLLPTLKQLQRKHPETRLMWFDHGRFWESPEEAEAAARARSANSEGRKKDWRPGGTHEDPRAKYQVTRDQKRARFKQRLGREHATGGERAPKSPFGPPSSGGVKGWNPEKRPASRPPSSGGVKGWNPEKRPANRPPTSGGVKGWNPEKRPANRPPSGRPPSGGRGKPAGAGSWKPGGKPGGASGGRPGGRPSGSRPASKPGGRPGGRPPGGRAPGGGRRKP